MSFINQLIVIIQTNITSVTSENWDDACEEIISNLLLLDFKTLIDNYQPCTTSLYISKE